MYCLLDTCVALNRADLVERNVAGNKEKAVGNQRQGREKQHQKQRHQPIHRKRLVFVVSVCTSACVCVRQHESWIKDA
jgi:hypothetical protein